MPIGTERRLNSLKDEVTFELLGQVVLARIAQGNLPTIPYGVKGYQSLQNALDEVTIDTLAAYVAAQGAISAPKPASTGSVNSSTDHITLNGLVSFIQAMDGVVLPTPQQPEEAVMDPPNMALRSSFNFSKAGVLTARPQSMIDRGGGGNGPFWPTHPIPMPSAQYPDRHLIYYSPDHDEVNGTPGSGTGGIYVLCAVADIRVAANWKTYAAAIEAGWFDDIPSRPAKEPIYIGPYAANTPVQAETPQVMWVPEGSCWVMTYQVTGGYSRRASGVPYSNQGTVMAKSVDGLNWTGTDLNVTEVQATEPGDGHTGYLQWGKNPFPALINPTTGAPWKYIGYSLIGGQNIGARTQWGHDNPSLNVQWTALARMNNILGRASPSPTSNTIGLQSYWMDVPNIRATSQGFQTNMVGGVFASGSTISERAVYEVLLDPLGREVIAKPQLVLSKGSGSDADYASVANLYWTNFADKRVGVYEGQTNGTIGNSLMLALSDKRNPLNTIFAPLDPPTPTTDVTTTRIVLPGLSAIPAGWTEVWAGSDKPVVTFDAEGMTVALDPAKGHEYYLFEDEGFVPGFTPMADVFIENWIGLASGTRYPYIGFASAKVARGAMQNAVFVSNGEGTGLKPRLSVIAGGVLTSGGDWQQYFAVGYGGSTSTRVFKDIGLRWFPRGGAADTTPRLYGLGLGKIEAQVDTPLLGAIDRSIRYYRFFGWKSVAGTASIERVQAFGGVKQDLENVLEDVIPFGSFTQGVATSGSFARSRPGATITTNIPGITIDNGVFPQTYAGTPTAPGVRSFTQTKAGAVGSPRTTPVTVAEGVDAFVYATFTAPDNTPISSVPPEIGPAWTVTGSTTPLITGNRLSGIAAGNGWRLVLPVNPPTPNYYVEADFTVITLIGDPALNIRCATDNADSHMAATYQAATGLWRLLRITAGVVTIVQTFSMPMVEGQTARVRFAGTNNAGNTLATFNVFVNDMTTPILTGTTNVAARLVPGYVGIQQRISSAVRPTAGIHIDNFKATAL